MPNFNRVVRKYMLRQTLVYWEKTGSDSYGKPAFASPVELRCRWEDKQQEILTSDGRKVISKTTLLLADRVLDGGLVFLGELADLPVVADPPTQNQGASEVMKSNFSPEANGKSTIYEAYL